MEHRPASWTVLLIAAVAQFMVILDVTVVNVALPSIGERFAMSPSELRWVVTAYLLFGGSLLLLGGRASDLLGRRRVFLTGLTIFAGASLLSGLAWSGGALLAARAGQGVGAALLSPAALSIVTTTYQGAQRTRALAVWGAIGSAGGAIGLVLGGMLTTWVSWRLIFVVNAPIGLVAGLAALRAVPAARGAGGARLRHLDVAGAALATAGLVLLVLATSGADAHGWGSGRTLGLLAGSAALLALFAAAERAVAAPLVPPATWRVRSLVVSAVTMLVATGLLVATFFLTSLALQDGRGWSALETGLAFLPMVLAIGASAHAGSHVVGHAGTRKVVAAGLGLVALGAAVLATAPDAPTYLGDLLPGLLLIGGGIGAVFVGVNVTAMSDVAHEQAGLASGLMTTAHEIGGAVGVAVFGAAGGYADAFTVAALVAATLALLVVTRLPARRPPAGAHVAMH